MTNFNNPVGLYEVFDAIGRKTSPSDATINARNNRNFALCTHPIFTPTSGLSGLESLSTLEKCSLDLVIRTYEKGFRSQQVLTYTGPFSRHHGSPAQGDIGYSITTIKKTKP